MSFDNQNNYLHHSVEYNQSCDILQKECQRLLEIGEKYLNLLSELSKQYREGTASQIFATGGFLHRGAYCPSPIIDLVTGNLSRGRILKKPTARSKINHIFGFNVSGQLIYDQQIYDDVLYATEYVIYIENSIYGVTVDKDGFLLSVSEELYAQEHLKEYRYANYGYTGNEHACYQFCQELYLYDNIGLVSCDSQTFYPDKSIIKHNQYNFQRQNGYLWSYTVASTGNNPNTVLHDDTQIFYIKKKRKA